MSGAILGRFRSRSRLRIWFLRLVFFFCCRKSPLRFAPPPPPPPPSPLPYTDISAAGVVAVDDDDPPLRPRPRPRPPPNRPPPPRPRPRPPPPRPPPPRPPPELSMLHLGGSLTALDTSSAAEKYPRLHACTRRQRQRQQQRQRQRQRQRKLDLLGSPQSTDHEPRHLGLGLILLITASLVATKSGDWSN